MREHKTGVLELPRDCTTSLWATTRGPRKPPHIGPAPAGAGASCVPPTCPPSSSGKAVRGWPGARHIGAGCRCDWASTAPLWRCRHLRHQARGLAVRGVSARPHNGPASLNTRSQFASVARMERASMARYVCDSPALPRTAASSSSAVLLLLGCRTCYCCHRRRWGGCGAMLFLQPATQRHLQTRRPPRCEPADQLRRRHCRCHCRCCCLLAPYSSPAAWRARSQPGCWPEGRQLRRRRCHLRHGRRRAAP